MARIIVCERGGRWTAAWRRRLQGRAEVAQCRLLSEAEAFLNQWPGSVAAVEVSENELAQTLAWLAAFEFRFPASRAVALAGPEIAEAYPVLREAGAMAVVSSLVGLRPVVEQAVAHVAGATRTERSAIERMMAELPWGE